MSADVDTTSPTGHDRTRAGTGTGTGLLNRSAHGPQAEDPPFLQERTEPVEPPAPLPLVERLAEVVYRQKAASAIVLASLVLVAMALAYQPPPEDSLTGRQLPSTPEPAGALGIEQVLRAVGSSTTIIDTTGSAGAPAAPEASTPPATGPDDTGPTTTAAPTTVPTTVPTTAPPTTAAPTTAPPTTAPPTTPPPTTQPTTVPTTAAPPSADTVVPRFCIVWIDDTTEVRAAPDDDAQVLAEVGFSLFQVLSITASGDRWYLIDAGGTTGWVSGDDADRQGDCRRNRG